MLFKYRMHNNPKLAEQLMFGSVDDKVSEINERLWQKFDGNRFDYYLNIVKICGKPITPRARYVIAMAYSWNSTIYCTKAIYYLELYLKNRLYKNKCANNGTYTTSVRTNLHLTEMYCYLANAYKNNKDYDSAINSCYTAIQHSPNITYPYIRLAEIYSIKKDLQKSVDILEKAKSSIYSKHSFQNNIPGELFIDIDIINKKLNEYKQRLYIQTNYTYNQKQVRELVMSKLQKQNININLTQPKLKLICDYFNLKNNDKYFYKYPDSDIFRCSQSLVDILVNSLLNNPNLAEEIKNITN